MEMAEASGNETGWRLVRALRKAGSELLHDFPNLDFGLMALARTYRPPGPAIERQYSTAELIRPRALYTGLAPMLCNNTGASPEVSRCLNTNTKNSLGPI